MPRLIIDYWERDVFPLPVLIINNLKKMKSNIHKHKNDMKTEVSTKITYSLFLVFLSINAFSQVAIGKTSITNTSVSLEFGNENRGIVLPWVESETKVTTTGVVDGTLIYDTSDHKVKLRANSGWKDLSVDATGFADTSIQDTKTDKPIAKVVIGADGATNTTPGILVLSDSDKAMILPKVASPHLNIMKPAAGMIVYDTVSRQLAVYNGKVWSFWKPE